MAATYNSPWLTVRDEIRFLAQDNAVESGTTVANAIFSDQDIDDPITAHGTRAGAVTVFRAYANYFGQQIVATTEGPESTRWGDRAKQMEVIADGIANGTIQIGDAGAPQVQRGELTTGAVAAAFYRRYGWWPRTAAFQF